MKCYRENSVLLGIVWKRLRQRFSRYPKPLRALADELVSTLGPHPSRYFSGPDAGPILHLPIWLARGTCRRGLPDLLEGTALAYFYVRIQDNVVDEPATRGRTPLLLLGNIFLTDAISLVSRFVDSPSFWAKARAAWMVSAAETEAEREALSRGGSYGGREFRRHARKVALARIPLYAILERQGCGQKKDVDRLIDLLGEAYGLANDALGFERDLASRTPTYLLSLLRKELSAREQNRPEAIQRVVIAHPHVETFLERAIAIHLHARPIGESLGIHSMERYTRERVSRLRWHCKRITIRRIALALAHAKSSQ